MKWFFMCVLGLAVIFIGCDTPYTGFLGAGDIDGYLESAGAETVCLADGFDSICIQTIPGVSAVKMAKMAEMAKTVNLSSVREGRAVPRVNPEGTGAVVYLELEKIVTEIETVEVPVIEKEIFVLHVSRTETTYITPIGAVFVPENAPIEAPVWGPKVTTDVQRQPEAPKVQSNSTNTLPTD